MKQFLFLIVIILMNTSCGNSKVEVTGADKYINVITGFTCKKAAVTDNGYLVIAIDAIGTTNYDKLASQFLAESKREGVKGLKGVLIVDIKNCQFQEGAVTGKRIGKAYNK